MKNEELISSLTWQVAFARAKKFNTSVIEQIRNVDVTISGEHHVVIKAGEDTFTHLWTSMDTRDEIVSKFQEEVFSYYGLKTYNHGHKRKIKNKKRTN